MAVPVATLPGSAFDGDAAIVDAAAFLGTMGLFGTLWLDAQMIVRRTFGKVADFVRVGEPVTESLLALIGQEDRIVALKTDAQAEALTIPNVALMAAYDGAANIRLNITVFWRSEVHAYLVLLGRVLSQDLVDQTVEDEIRKRRIADAELARVNRQLEEFAYVISHDLKAPLRALRYYSEDVREALQADPPDAETARASAANIAMATRRMGNMLTGLLEFARIGRQHEAIETVDTAALVDDIIANAGRPDGMQLSRTGSWPTIRTTPAPLDLVLRNLVDNAIKHHDRDTGAIDVAAQDIGAALLIDVIDDGAGITRDWHEAIFEPFRRIDDTKVPESSGIGLALVKRTIEIAGGRIELRSDPERARGTTFRVTWPKA